MCRLQALHRALLPLVLIPALCCPGAPRAQYFELPDLASSADTVMTQGAEARLGKAFMQQVRERLPVLDDPLLTGYIESLGRSLVAAAPDATGRRFRFFLIDEPVVNAFAGPGGYIGVYAGLVLAAQTESELAAVIAHEIAHVTQRHLMRGFEDQSRLSVPATALLVAAAILGAQVSGDAGMAAIAGIQAAAIQHRINFTRENEKEADRIGISTLVRAEHDPFAMAGFFERLSRAGQIHDSAAPEFLRTHPVTANRIAEALERAESYGARQRPDSLRFHLTRARLRERGYDRAEQAVAHFRATLREGRHRNAIAERYGYALALTRARDYRRAEAELGALLAARPSQPEFIVLEAELAQRLGRSDEALGVLSQTLSLSPNDWVIGTVRARLLLEQGRAAQALEALEDLVRLRPDSVMLYDLLERAAIKSGDRAATHRYRAERLYLLGDLEPAIRQLEIALRQRDIPYHDAAQIQARLDMLREEEREQRERDDPLG
ncbi:M48 family metalloprotease [Marichromatium bheemlicum]|uniref:Putative beta-barrel assembly-enhancing protease n=1 Tax=Marichromatium bheemlicum TaxID=365339 RepID=A0ABX1IAK1_9GAMM|nr:M48 family metalloprotease [Marichromatium bheemlicum]NKN33126.1 M48 family metallopeptidase [Marichromatium bheemlicum]